jgi:mRNA interferase RelE/StbE
MFRIELSRKAAKFYQKADNVTLKRLNLAFSKLSEDPFRHYNIKKLSGELEGSFRLRLGGLRIIYSVDDKRKIVYIEVIGFRGDVYKA